MPSAYRRLQSFCRQAAVSAQTLLPGRRPFRLPAWTSCTKTTTSLYSPSPQACLYREAPGTATAWRRGSPGNGLMPTSCPLPCTGWTKTPPDFSRQAKPTGPHACSPMPWQGAAIFPCARNIWPGQKGAGQARSRRSCTTFWPGTDKAGAWAYCARPQKGLRKRAALSRRRRCGAWKGGNARCCSCGCLPAEPIRYGFSWHPAGMPLWATPGMGEKRKTHLPMQKTRGSSCTPFAWNCLCPAMRSSRWSSCRHGSRPGTFPHQ